MPDNRPSNREQVRVIDFFSGCGGTSAGLQKAGMKILLGIDIDPDAAATFQANFPEARFLCRDIRKVRITDLEPHLPNQRPYPLLFSACAPCQPFSKQNREKDRSDKRASLLNQLHRFVRRFRPEYILLENVPGIGRTKREDGPIDRFCKVLEEHRYHFDSAVVNFLDYGIPQTRRRFVLTASRLGTFNLPAPTHGGQNEEKPHSTVWEWIGHLPPISAGEKSDAVPNHWAAGLSPLNLKRIANTPEGGDRRDWPEELIPPCHRHHQGHTDVYGRLSRQRPASTLTTRCISFSNGRFGHPTQDRALSVREAAYLQTFPPDFVFTGSLASMASQVGNAVPFLFARQLGKAIKDHFESRAHRGGL